ncbi:WG repeat-containing protein [Elizabethkingia anophelis]|uniref:WG repeat-containing protein n=1 Tax=Elizabethkingia anophelis TaxID=1117645 RepID=UPI003891C0A3
MNKIFAVTILFFSCFIIANGQQNRLVQVTSDKNDIPELIPVFKNGKYGYINTAGRLMIPPKFNLALFFTEDCNLTQSPNENIRLYGKKNYATVEIDKVAYRIDKTGKALYRYKNEDLGRCKKDFQMPAFTIYKNGENYGLVKKDLQGVADLSQVYIIPQYQYLFVMDSDDQENPMIIAIKNDKFGVVDKNNRVVIGFEYEDIKKNLSWKEAHLFEVSQDGKKYFFMDKASNKYQIKARTQN